MPIYEYRCNSCGHQQEVIQKFSDAPLTVCSACHQSTLMKMISAAGFQLKGSGWYATDFKGGVKQSAATPATTTENATPAAAKSVETKAATPKPATTE